MSMASPEKIDIPITKEDLRLFLDVVVKNKTLKWSFPTDKGTMINIEFMTEDEHEQRNK